MDSSVPTVEPSSHHGLDWWRNLPLDGLLGDILPAFLGHLHAAYNSPFAGSRARIFVNSVKATFNVSLSEESFENAVESITSTSPGILSALPGGRQSSKGEAARVNSSEGPVGEMEAHPSLHSLVDGQDADVVGMLLQHVEDFTRLSPLGAGRQAVLARRKAPGRVD